MRDITKRLYNMIFFYYPQGEIKFHSSGMPVMSHMSFARTFWDGENLGSVINQAQPTFRGFLNPERFRAEYMGTNWGPEMLFLGQGRIPEDTAIEYGPDELTDHIHGMQLLHSAWPSYDIVSYKLIARFPGINSRLQRVLRKYNLISPEYDFLPYWEHHVAELLPGTGIPDGKFYASFYTRRPDDDTFEFETRTHQVVCIFCNESDWQGLARVKLDWKALGFGDWLGVKAENAVHKVGFRIENYGKPEERDVLFPQPQESAEVINGEVVFPLTEWNYRMIILEKEMAAE
jgi:hypothetical protein